MNAFENISLILECSVVLYFFQHLFLDRYSKKTKNIQLNKTVIYSAIAFGFISILIGGLPSLFAFVKVAFFSIVVLYSLKHASLASWVLIASLIISLFSQAADGNVLNKLSTIPFLILACIFIQLKDLKFWGSFYILALSLILEFMQSIVLESRGLLIASSMATLLLILPTRLIRNTVICSAILLPILYPLLLTFVYQELIIDSGVFTSTSSNFERSAMSAWSIDNFFRYPFVGPGSFLFSEEMNAVKITEGHSVADLYDPHQFLLSIWIFLGGITTFLIYLLWCNLWFLVYSRTQLTLSRNIKTYAILAIFSVLTFTLSPPDSASRVQVALLAGISIFGLRESSVMVNS